MMTTAHSIAPQDWRLAAVRLGASFDRPRNLVQTRASQEPLELAYYIWVLRADRDSAVVIDAGFTPEAGARRNVQIAIEPAAALEKLGIRHVSSILLTHLHWDHCGGLELLPPAPVHVSADELGWLKLAESKSTGELQFYDRDVLDTLRAGTRLIPFVSKVRLIPNVATARRVGAHTTGFSIVELDDGRDQRICLLGDLAYTQANIALNAPPSIALDGPACVALYQRYEDWLRVPGHDPQSLIALGTRIHEHITVR